MRTIRVTSIIFSLIIAISGCEQPNQIKVDGKHSMMRSFMQLKQRMKFREGVEFEVAFWSLKQKSGSEDVFRNLVAGKTPEEVIEMGKQYFADRKSQNDPQYTQHASWDSMIEEVITKVKTPVTKKNQPSTNPAQNKANRIMGF
ncbi:MAG: hypothetical protein K0U68_07860 [Gammaproteobacteria bacterium]|nr:hypothetical protein [Gammaproteobacteria bacterium]